MDWGSTPLEPNSSRLSYRNRVCTIGIISLPLVDLWQSTFPLFFFQ